MNKRIIHTVQYLGKWKKYPMKQATWLNETELTGCDNLIREYEEAEGLSAYSESTGIINEWHSYSVGELVQQPGVVFTYYLLITLFIRCLLISARTLEMEMPADYIRNKIVSKTKKNLVDLPVSLRNSRDEQIQKKFFKTSSKELEKLVGRRSLEKIVGRRFVANTQYYVKFKNSHVHEDMWLDETHLGMCHNLIKEFESNCSLAHSEVISTYSVIRKEIHFPRMCVHIIYTPI